jgi:hypothetical protein
MKNETLEEAAKRYSYGGREGGHRTSFLEGVKWQEEKTKKEMLFFGEWIFDQFDLNKDIPVFKLLEEYLIVNQKLQT